MPDTNPPPVIVPDPPAPAVSPTGTPMAKFLGIPAVAVTLYVMSCASGTVAAAGMIAPSLHLSDTITGGALLIFVFIASMGVVSQGARLQGMLK